MLTWILIGVGGLTLIGIVWRLAKKLVWLAILAVLIGSFVYHNVTLPKIEMVGEGIHITYKDIDATIPTKVAGSSLKMVAEEDGTYSLYLITPNSSKVIVSHKDKNVINVLTEAAKQQGIKLLSQ